jgi:hypothetical protein
MPWDDLLDAPPEWLKDWVAFARENGTVEYPT